MLHICVFVWLLQHIHITQYCIIQYTHSCSYATAPSSISSILCCNRQSKRLFRHPIPIFLFLSLLPFTYQPAHVHGLGILAFPLIVQSVVPLGYLTLCGRVPPRRSTSSSSRLVSSRLVFTGASYIKSSLNAEIIERSLGLPTQAYHLSASPRLTSPSLSTYLCDVIDVMSTCKVVRFGSRFHGQTSVTRPIPPVCSLFSHINLASQDNLYGCTILDS